MKKLIRITFLITLIGIFIVGCEKENISDIPASENISLKSKSKSKQNKSNDDYSNENNPYDLIGATHNQKLDEWIAQKEQIETNVVDTNNFFYSETINDLNSLIPNNSAEEAFIDNIINNLAELDDNQNSFESNLNLILESERANYFISELADIMDPDVTINRNLEDHLSLILDLEEEIMAESEENENLSEGDKVILLMSTSVARHSSGYWYEVEHNLSPWGTLGSGNGNAALSWGDIGIADLSAFADACIVGMGVGVGVIIATGGLAAGPALAGVAGGAAWGSAKNAGSQLGWW